VFKVFKAVVFDWSGTLSDDSALCLDADNRLLGRHGHAPITLQKFREYYLNRDLVSFYEREFGIRFASHAEMQGEYERALRESEIKPKPYPKAAETLAALKNAGLHLFVLSAHPQRVLESEARDYDFHDFFEKNGFIGSVWDKTDTLKRIVSENGLEKEKTLFAGDVVLDVKAGKKAGVRTCACAYGYHPRAWLERDKPDFLIGDVSELVKVVGIENNRNGK